MTDKLQRLADMAVAIWTQQAVSTDDFGFVLEPGLATFSFFSPSENSDVAYCRVCLAQLGDMPCPPGFAEDALQGNFFWTGTNGATLSYNEAENAFYLTDRFDVKAFPSQEMFEDYVNNALRTLQDWRARFALYIPAELATANEEER